MTRGGERREVGGDLEEDQPGGTELQPAQQG